MRLQQVKKDMDSDTILYCRYDCFEDVEMWRVASASARVRVLTNIMMDPVIAAMAAKKAFDDWSQHLAPVIVMTNSDTDGDKVPDHMTNAPTAKTRQWWVFHGCNALDVQCEGDGV